MASNSDPLAAQLIARSKTLVNNDLKKICKEEGQVQSGNKAQLQSRVIGIINDAVNRHDTDAIHRLRHRVHNHGEAPMPSSTSPTAPVFSHGASSAVSPNYSMSNGFGAHSAYGASIQQPHTRPSTGSSQSIFKSSPFFETRELLLSNIVLEASPSHRQTASRTLTLSPDLSARMKADSTLKLLLFSAMETPISGYNPLHDVTFPSQIEVKINGDEVKANYKGLKNKPGSTRPADITEYVRKVPLNYRNTIQITYALTQKKYNLYVYLVKKHSVEDLAKQIMQRNVITKQSVVNEMRKKANDPDIEVGSVNLSLKDPISTLRINVPCRSTICNHNQCFDAESFLQLQEQAPTWNCPICNKTVSFQALAVDQYVQEILESVPKSTDQVTIEKNGDWSHSNAANNQAPRTNGYGAYHDEDSDEDVIEVSDHRLSTIKSEAVPTPQSLTRTPPLSSREASSAPRTGSKRNSEAVVIDLISDDDEPVRPTKKVAYQTPISQPEALHRYHNHTPSFGVFPHRQPIRSLPRPYPGASPSSSSRDNLPSMPALPPSHPNGTSYGSYQQQPLPPPPPPPPSSRPSHPGQGSSSYPNYIGSSP